MPEKTAIRCALVTEDCRAITGNVLETMILNQMMYWSERVKDYDSFIAEERQRINDYINGSVTNAAPVCGWIYKSASELKHEIMSDNSMRTVLRRLDSLVKKGFLMRRHNPKYKFDHTFQYRVDYIAISAALQKYGYTLRGLAYEAFADILPEKTKRHILLTDTMSIRNNPMAQQYQRLHTESEEELRLRTYSSSYTKDILNNKNGMENFENCNSAEKAVAILFNETCPSYTKVDYVSKPQAYAIRDLLTQLGGDMNKVRQIFETAESTEYLKGNNEINWCASFEWLIQPNNAVKVLGGYYFDKSGSSSHFSARHIKQELTTALESAYSQNDSDANEQPAQAEILHISVQQQALVNQNQANFIDDLVEIDDDGNVEYVDIPCASQHQKAAQDDFIDIDDYDDDEIPVMHDTVQKAVITQDSDNKLVVSDTIVSTDSDTCDYWELDICRNETEMNAATAISDGSGVYNSLLQSEQTKPENMKTSYTVKIDMIMFFLLQYLATAKKLIRQTGWAEKRICEPEIMSIETSYDSG